MSRKQNIRGIVIRTRIFVENDLIISILTDEGMHIECVAKGAGGKSKRKSHLEVMNLIDASLYQGKQHFYLQEVRSKNCYVHLKDNLEKILESQLLLEIIQKGVLQEDPHPEVYKLLIETFEDLNKKESHNFTIQRALIQLAHLLGFLPSFKNCGTCHKEIITDEGHFNQENSTLHCQSCANDEHIHLALKYRKVFEFCRNASKEEYEKVHIEKADHALIKSIVPHFFTPHFNSPLKSLSFV
ncbi:DNA repair protein RecO [Candidatus Peregrinibacteria bacterium]|jgi:DNA repair protein RecO (recombination protein O)|nr:DNA repair protein RecO [Candidatus Peregrinibacteria bacterium]MBT4632193.1 DNA repair protein RecO [Candidatus Peregrinibacteria bacterium]MBT5516543.1 DNA repair protein RecO [Candidatus Peregrinibacteria bacterium]MBT5824140.1 DNA repair protein RecO [Candidatus Peregrinibacteria bacterium]